MKNIKLTIDGTEVSVAEGTSLLGAAQSAGIYIPTICYHPHLPPDGSCGLCLVEVEGRQDFPLACNTPAADGMVVRTGTLLLQVQRKDALKKVLAHHPCACLTCWRRERCDPFFICLRNVAVTARCVTCAKNKICELQKVVDYIGLAEEEFPYTCRDMPVCEEPFFDRDYNLCIGCSRCVRMCRDVRGIEAISMVERDGQPIPQPSDGKALKSSGCRLCCACVEVCPTGALMDREAKWNPDVKRESIVSPCGTACPSGIDVPLYVSLCGEGEYAEALGVIREKVPFPGVLGRVCIHPCEQACRRNQVNQKPIWIKTLKRYAADHGGEQWKQFSKQLPPTGNKVAVVGAGPSGLTAAYYLAKLGHSVTVFEALPEPGGMMRVGIPDYRLPKDVLKSEIDEMRRVGVDIRVNSRVESLDALFDQGYHAVYVALGAHRGSSLRIDGENLPGVMDGASFLRSVALGQKVNVGGRVAVIGGGNVAIDSARTALRLGAKQVTIVYRRTRGEMPASAEEVEAAVEEKINLLFLAAPVKIDREDDHLSLVCQRMELGEPDASGRRRPVPVKGSEFATPFDSIIAAIGQTSDIPAKFGIKVSKGNTIEVDPKTLATSRPGVYAGGDVVLGPASVIEGIAQGRIAATSIDRYLGGSGDISEVLATKRLITEYVGKDVEFQDRLPPRMPCLHIHDFAGNFAETELGLDEAAARAEGKRCLNCEYRCQIKPVPLPPVKARKEAEAEKARV